MIYCFLFIYLYLYFIFYEGLGIDVLWVRKEMDKNVGVWNDGSEFSDLWSSFNLGLRVFLERKWKKWKTKERRILDKWEVLLGFTDICLFVFPIFPLIFYSILHEELNDNFFPVYSALPRPLYHICQGTQLSGLGS